MRKKQFYQCVLFLSVILSTIGVLSLFYIFSSEIKQSLYSIEGGWTILIIILIRIAVTLIMGSFMFRKWFKQEEQYLSDIPFLFGFFFLVLMFGKGLDLVVYCTYYTLDTETFLILLKIRHFVIILTFLPLIYLSLEIILYLRSLKENREKLKDEKYRNKLRIKLILIIFAIESVAVALYPNTIVAGIVLACIAIPSLLVIVWMFYFAYKNNRLSQVHPLILSIGFGLYTISQITRPLAQNIIGEIASYIIFAEIIDLLIFIVIFIGLIKKIKQV